MKRPSCDETVTSRAMCCPETVHCCCIGTNCWGQTSNDDGCAHFLLRWWAKQLRAGHLLTKLYRFDRGISCSLLPRCLPSSPTASRSYMWSHFPINCCFSTNGLFPVGNAAYARVFQERWKEVNTMSVLTSLSMIEKVLRIKIGDSVLTFYAACIGILAEEFELYSSRLLFECCWVIGSCTNYFVACVTSCVDDTFLCVVPWHVSLPRFRDEDRAAQVGPVCQVLRRRL